MCVILDWVAKRLIGKKGSTHPTTLSFGLQEHWGERTTARAIRQTTWAARTPSPLCTGVTPEATPGARATVLPLLITTICGSGGTKTKTQSSEPLCMFRLAFSFPGYTPTTPKVSRLNMSSGNLWLLRINAKQLFFFCIVIILTPSPAFYLTKVMHDTVSRHKQLIDSLRLSLITF